MLIDINFESDDVISNLLILSHAKFLHNNLDNWESRIWKRINPQKRIQSETQPL